MPNDADTAVADAVDALRQAMVDRGDDPGQVEAQLSAVRPRVQTFSGNFADLNRMGVEAAAEGEAEEEGGYDSWTKAELQAELDSQGIEYSTADTKADLVAKLG